MKKLAVEFTNGERKELPLQGNAALFIGNDGEPKLFSDSPDIVETSDATQELAVDDLVRRVSTTAAASVATIADGLYIGQRITVLVDGLLDASTLVLTSATGILKVSDSSELTSLDFDTESEYATLEWTPGGWQIVRTSATETA